MAKEKQLKTKKEKNIKEEVKVKKTAKAKEPVKKEKPKKTEKVSAWTKIKTFCAGVKSEFKKVHWPSKKDMVKYSVATIVLIIFLALFFYVIDIIFALIQTLLK